MSDIVHVQQGSAVEAARLARVRHYEVLDAPPDGTFDDIAALAAAVCNTPIATVSIVDAGRVWFAATHGLAGVTQVGDEPGLCASAILTDGPYVVGDAALDPRTLHHPLVRGELGLRFYAAAPITIAGGHRLGTVNVIDREPRRLTQAQIDQLATMARVVARHLEVRLGAIHAVRAEQELREDATELRRLDAVKDGFLAMVSHEMRTPLTAILGFTELLREVLTEEHQDLLEPIERNGRDMYQLVERLLDHSRLAAGRGAIEPQAVRLAEHVRICLRQLESVLGAREVVVDVGPDVVVHADPAALERILVNLVGNAAKYSKGSAPIRIGAEPGTSRVIVSVSDSGPGIAAEYHTEIFDQFFRVPGPATATRGTGIGLAIVRHYVELHGGKIWVTSAPGEGATFSFDLPEVGSPK